MERKKYKCPICDKEIEIEEDGKWIYHRPWAFHIAIDHADLFKTKIIPKEDIPLWLRFLWLDKKTQEELVRVLKQKTIPLK